MNSSPLLLTYYCYQYVPILAAIIATRLCFIYDTYYICVCIYTYMLSIRIFYYVYIIQWSEM